MHRIDVATATGRPLDVDETHDGRLVADLVADWAITHDEPFTLTLTGPAGGTFISGHGGEHVNVDAVDFARTLAGRLPGQACSLMAPALTRPVGTRTTAPREGRHGFASSSTPTREMSL